jgi:NAD(P)-dependent dehydrogenase (short-subunit alcohol dehydrogenase family)
MNLLYDRVAVVTGGSRGIGKAIARAFAEQGAKVALCSRDAAGARQAADEISPEGGRVLAFRADVTDLGDVRSLVRDVVTRWGQIHIVVNNAGMNARIPIDADEEGRWVQVLHSSVLGTYYVTREVLRHMPSRGGGRVINISSILGKFGVPGYTAYCSAKHGIVGFTRALALEVANRGITVNAICPGWTETDMAAQGMRETGAVMGISQEEFRRQALEAVPIQRILDPMEIAYLAVYLATDASSGMTGQSINLCGGQVMY